MGISQPYLAILSTMAFISIVVSLSFFYLYIIDQANKTPVLGVYADSRIDPDTNEITVYIVIRHERGRTVEIQRIMLINESSVITIDNFNETIILGCRNREIPAGGTCIITLKFPPGSFSENKTYQGLVYFNEGVYPVAFTPSRLYE
ncbi:MAG: hypothetical protein QXW36_03050 [Desulfurococcaceae archaeon]